MTKYPRLILEIDPQLRNRFKAKCIIQGKTMKEVLTEFMENYDPEEKKKGGRKSNNKK